MSRSRRSAELGSAGVWLTSIAVQDSAVVLCAQGWNLLLGEAEWRWFDVSVLRSALGVRSLLRPPAHPCAATTSSAPTRPTSTKSKPSPTASRW